MPIDHFEIHRMPDGEWLWARLVDGAKGVSAPSLDVAMFDAFEARSGAVVFRIVDGHKCITRVISSLEADLAVDLRDYFRLEARFVCRKLDEMKPTQAA